MTVGARLHTATELAGLRFQRLRGGVPWPAQALGGSAFSPADTALPLLWPGGALIDAWSGSCAPQAVRSGHVRYATDGQWLHGTVEIADEAFAGGLQGAARQAYAELFGVLQASGCPHPLRLWNYFSGINLVEAGTERYQQFNAGRQQAFADAGRSALEGSPAACALGTADGPLRVHFLAGRNAPIAIENPRQVSAYHYPDRYGRHAPTFSRAALVDAGCGARALFISGTASIVGHASMHSGDVRRQTAESLANIARVIDAARARASAVADASAGADASADGGAEFAAQELVCTVYLRHASDLPIVREMFERHVGSDSPAARDAIYVRADICRAELLVEIEGHAIALCDGSLGGAA